LHINITEVNKETVLNALQNKKINDFEDGIEYYVAEKSKCDVIVTEDLDDFYFSNIEVLNSNSFID
jgi:predicted nucleic acid-binding protein